MDNNEMISRVYQLCEERGWSRVRLSREAKVLDSTLRNAIVRKTYLSIPTLIAYCKAFGITLEQFFAKDEDTTIKLTKQEVKLVKDFRVLESSLKLELCSLAKTFKKFKKVEQEEIEEYEG